MISAAGTALSIRFGDEMINVAGHAEREKHHRHSFKYHSLIILGLGVLTVLAYYHLLSDLGIESGCDGAMIISSVDNALLQPGAQRKARMAGVVGNVIEWYDFALYGYLAAIIGRLFFPAEDATASLLASYGVFAAGFLMRPIGAIFFGWLGDTIGRGRTMLISVAMMAFPTIALGLLPDYATIGLAAPILLIVIRLIQGLSVGGEFSSSVTYMVETAAKHRRGQAGSWANVGSMSGMLLGSAAAALVTTTFSDVFLESCGWRLPFLFGGVLGLIAIALRRDTDFAPFSRPRSGDTVTVSLQAVVAGKQG